MQGNRHRKKSWLGCPLIVLWHLAGTWSVKEEVNMNVDPPSAMIGRFFLWRGAPNPPNSRQDRPRWPFPATATLLVCGCQSISVHSLKCLGFIIYLLPIFWKLILFLSSKAELARCEPKVIRSWVPVFRQEVGQFFGKDNIGGEGCMWGWGLGKWVKG